MTIAQNVKKIRQDHLFYLKKFKVFFNKVLKNLLYFKIASRIRLNKTLSINKKKCKIELFI